MAFGDVAQTLTGSRGFESGAVVITLTETPAAGDILVASVAGGNVNIDASGSGFTKDQETLGASTDYLATWTKVATGASDNSISLDDAGGDDPIVAILSLVRGPFTSTPIDLTAETAEVGTNPVATGASGGSIAQTDEILVGTFSAFGGEATGTWARQGTATPTSNMTQSGAVGSGSFWVHQAIQTLTATGTVGISRDNPNTDDCILQYVSYKKSASAAPTGTGTLPSQASSLSGSGTIIGYPAYGYATPDAGEIATSWTTWHLGAGAGIAGDANYGDLVIPAGVTCDSPVVNMGDANNKTITLSTKYGSNVGTVTRYIRGSATTFAWDAGSPSWTEYTGAVTQTWQYVQARLVGA